MENGNFSGIKSILCGEKMITAEKFIIYERNRDLESPFRDIRYENIGK